MSHLNGLERDYAARGLSVLGLTSEARDRTDAWVEAREIAFAYGFESGDVARSLGVRSFPVAFLVAPDGRIVWEGHPRGVDAKLLDQHLEGALEKPLYEWEGDAVAIREAYLAGRYADALRAAVELAREDPLGEEAQRVLGAILEARVASLEAALQRGDVLRAMRGAEALEPGLQGLPELERVRAIRARVTEDEALAAQLRVQERVLEVTARTPKRKSECRQQMDALRRLCEGYEGTFVGQQIEAKIQELYQLRNRLLY